MTTADQLVRTELLTLLSDVRPAYPLVRYGPNADGGYVVPDLPYAHCTTIGVGADVQFEAALGARHGTRFDLWDPTVNGLPYRLSNSRFFAVGLGGRPIQGYLPCAPLQTMLMTTVGHQLLKIDCEGGEWDAGARIDECDLQPFSAIVLEIHDLERLELWPHYLRVIRHFSDGFVLVNQHGNNFGGSFELDGEQVPKVLELTWVNRKLVNGVVGFQDLNFPNGPGPELRWRRRIQG